MTAKQLKYFLIILSFFVSLNLGNARDIKTKRAEYELSKEKAPINSLEDDVDLENFLEDYYDDLWQYLESRGRDPGKIKKKKKEEVEKEKISFTDYDYMSDMPTRETETDGSKFKDLDKNLMGDGKENFTWLNVSEHNVNESYGDGGILDVIRANRESNSQEEYPLRSKQMRLKSIIEQVLSFRGGTPKMNGTFPDSKQYNALREIYEKSIKKIKTDEWASSYSEKIQSFYPSCDLPRNTDEDVWADPYSMNLLFDLDYPSPQEDSTIMIVTAKLRLFKFPQENYSTPNVETSTPKVKWEKTQNNFGILPVDDDRQIRVSVFWYTRSLRRHRAKKKLLDSQMLSLYAAKWTEFNIRPAVRTWKESGKNFGLVVNVEDEDGSLLPAEQYIQTMNCSKWTATIRPIPSIFLDRVNQYYIENPLESKNDTTEDQQSDRHKIFSYQSSLYPILDLRTREVPNSDVKSMALVNSAKKALETKFLNLQRKGFNAVNDSIGIFLKKHNLDLEDIMRLPKIDKSFLKKSETKNGESRGSYFQNVPIGSPSRGISEEMSPKEEKEAENEEEEEKIVPKIRHNRKQWDLFQKTANVNPRSRDDFNVTDHH